MVAFLRTAVVGSFAGLVILAAGCGSGPPAVSSSNTEATVTGSVSVQGKRLSSGTISFDPANYERKDAVPRSAPIGKDGTFSLTTLIGENTVTIDSPEVQATREVASMTEMVDVQSGTNQVDLNFGADQQ